jgi:hypothetical protein
MSDVNADAFLNRCTIQRTLRYKAKQQGGCKCVGIHPELAEDLSGFHAAVHRLAGAFIAGKLAGDQYPRPIRTTQIDTPDSPLDCIEGIF